MCNLYSQTKSQDAMRHVFSEMLIGEETVEDAIGNLPAPIIQHGPQIGWQMVKARWGMPTPITFLEGKRTDAGVTNIRNLNSPHWRRWLG